MSGYTLYRIFIAFDWIIIHRYGGIHEFFFLKYSMQNFYRKMKKKD